MTERSDFLGWKPFGDPHNEAGFLRSNCTPLELADWKDRYGYLLEQLERALADGMQVQFLCDHVRTVQALLDAPLQ